MKKIILVIALLFLNACVSNQTEVDSLESANIVTGIVNGVETWGTSWGPGAFKSSGQRIYFTSTNPKDEFMAYSGGPKSDMMIGGYLTCASCHGPDGKGGIHEMYKYTMEVPDIRYSTLLVEKRALAAAGLIKSSEKDMDYSMEDLRRAVSNGVKPDGSRLNEYMPRWELTDQDLNDIFEYLKNLP